MKFYIGLDTKEGVNESSCVLMSSGNVRKCGIDS